ncbi:MAG TPA: thioredoxin family protein [Synergistales bacterium]|nr:thioredoxin family protein [Synergistales bacterium]
MKGILEEFREKHSTKVDVQIVDVWKQSDFAEKYSIRVVPTLIFLDSKGEEIFRNEGVMSMKQLENQWEELGYPLQERN